MPLSSSAACYFDSSPLEVHLARLSHRISEKVPSKPPETAMTSAVAKSSPTVPDAPDVQKVSFTSKDAPIKEVTVFCQDEAEVMRVVTFSSPSQLGLHEVSLWSYLHVGSQRLVHSVSKIWTRLWCHFIR